MGRTTGPSRAGRVDPDRQRSRRASARAECHEYRCEPCDHHFETLIRGNGDTAHCPKCGGIDLVKQFSIPAAAQTGHGRDSSLPVCEGGGPSFGCGQGHCGSGMCGLD